MATGTGRREVTEFFDEPLRGFVCERAAVQSAEFVLIQHMVKIAWGGGEILGVSQVYGGEKTPHYYRWKGTECIYLLMLTDTHSEIHERTQSYATHLFREKMLNYLGPSVVTKHRLLPKNNNIR